MNHFSTPNQPLLKPINPNWTISELLEQLAADEELAQCVCAPLARIEAALTEEAGADSWTRTPGSTALVRSLVRLCSVDPALGRLTLGPLISEAFVADPRQAA